MMAVTELRSKKHRQDYRGDDLGIAFVFEVGNFRVRTRVIAESCQLQQAAGAQYLQL